ncbi:hypothetical protein PBRA_005743 [Plasmodiophora brassicae]|uniref:CHCH domain-containing protein n=1 Tax=Plasmodiophora brassicae TaxID=37360 RepID=A0A0G4IPS9_PLABS|nr:hypothetical protein PBRA_005743 [Plasmodiophora brassicae]
MSSWRKDNPCAALADASYACIEKNDGDKSACDAHFQAYKACVKAETERRRRERLAANST